ncbi:efflux RND transporter periplasmic adaptor subunit [Shewanella mangrovisoli]|uniref:efflux RND transporter periplasmic adaptor subunit n=1 Tax=Shewanella mangrovisoli TaxID=2864211 RepID=UPI001C659437|nr:efflux RND transporter periplasmic adaptor subunit [Shewanella mangrovisoli]QYK10208.1 efflux RND transporter periplasmic adaptor subunit [Shewanella mangrovisoli]
MKKTIIAIALIAAVATAVSFSDVLQAAKPESAPHLMRTVPVVTGEVVEHPLAQSISLIGKLAADRAVVIAPQVTGKIKQIAVTSNQAVKKGQLLIELDDMKAQAAVAEANAFLNDETRKLREFEKLISRNAITQTEIDAQKASVDIARARLASAQADLHYHSLIAPFAGKTGLINFSEGKMVSIGTELMTLDDLSSMRLDLQVPEHFLSQLSIGMPVSATSRAWPGETFIGKVVAIDPRVNEETLNLKIRVQFENAKNRLKPGMMMSSTITFPPISAPIVPVQALEYSGTKRYVYVVGEDHIAHRTEVILGARVGDQVLIDSGLKIGDKVVVQGLVNMRDGLKINEVVLEAKNDANRPAAKSDVNTSETK